ncbi:LysR substrate-binding domain-containing protein [Luminiphilus sp. nBUS_16]|uniref:hydrogen peroxide-inducible genes activator n=1 Tax=unclassified Luminiphilus TaxID=2633198 RepID=UPI003EC0562E
MARQPTLKQLKYLCAVAEHQHFGRAAEASYVSQSTLSAGIQELEETLSASLIERNNRKVLLTSLGHDVVLRAQSMLVDVEELISLCAAAGEPFSGRMRLGVIPTIAPFILPQLLGSLRTEYPDFKLYIREDLSHQLVGALHAGELDVLLLALPFPADSVEVMSLMADDFLLASPCHHPLAKSTTLATADLEGEDLLLLEDGHCLRDHALEACKLRDSQISVPYQATSLATIVQMVANGIGVTLLPAMSVASGITAGTDIEVTPFQNAGIAREIGLMWRRKTPRAAEFRMLGDRIKACAQGAAGAND